jgi:hypothetical protein
MLPLVFLGGVPALTRVHHPDRYSAKWSYAETAHVVRSPLPAPPSVNAHFMTRNCRQDVAPERIHAWLLHTSLARPSFSLRL